jgi:hypothetical protein
LFSKFPKLKKLSALCIFQKFISSRSYRRNMLSFGVYSTRWLEIPR